VHEINTFMTIVNRKLKNLNYILKKKVYLVSVYDVVVNLKSTTFDDGPCQEILKFFGKQ
jgi:hypothetical protein